MKAVAIIGASERENRYANKAQRWLMERGFPVVPISPSGKTVLGAEGFSSLEDYPGRVDTVTLYIGSARVESVVEAVLRKAPRRVIFNPGTENAAAKRRFEEEGIETLEACTLVMLRTGQF